MKDKERNITNENEIQPDPLVAAWQEYIECRARPVGQIIFEGMGLYEGFDRFLERIVEDEIQDQG